MNSLEIREAKIRLIDMINGIALPLEVKRMMVKEILMELEATTEREINSFLSERESVTNSEEPVDNGKSGGKSNE